MKKILFIALSVFTLSCGKQREPLKTKEIQTEIQPNISLKTIQIANTQGYEKDTLSVSFAHTASEFINSMERQQAEAFLKQSLQEQDGMLSAFSNFNIKQTTKVIKNEAGVLGFWVEQMNNGEKRTFTRYYDVAQQKQILASDIFYPKENFDKLAALIRDKNPKAQGNSFDPTDENYPAFQFDEKGNLTLHFQGASPIKIKAEELAPYTNKAYRTVFHYPPAVDCNSVPCVALTFDDGPSVYTPKLLDILKENDAKATFFVLGVMVNQYPEILKRAYQEGHQIGNHSWNHKDLKRLSKQAVEEQIFKTNDIVKKNIGEEPKLLRPPYGSYNPMVVATANMPVILWDIDPLDWKYRNSASVAQKISKAERNSIILAHDIHKTTVDAMPEVIKNLKAKGFHLVTIEDLFYGKSLENTKVYNKAQ